MGAPELYPRYHAWVSPECVSTTPATGLEEPISSVLGQAVFMSGLRTSTSHLENSGMLTRSIFHSWNKDLAYRRATAMGGEFKKKGVNMLLGPVVGPIGRVVESGRYWEGMYMNTLIRLVLPPSRLMRSGFSVDPYLCGSLVYETVSGVQGAGVITSTKVHARPC